MTRISRFFAALVLAGLAVPAAAQIQSGSILVRATDQQGAIVPGVSVTISSPVLVAGSMTGVTDSGDLTLRRWRVSTGGASLGFSEEIVAEAVRGADPGELPTRDPRRVGREYRYGYLLGSRTRRDGGLVFEGLVKHDFRTGSRERWDPGAGREANEFLFVPGGPGEDEGHLLSYVYDPERKRSDLVVLDATDVSAGPVATVKLPTRVPYGFHATWVPA